MNFKVKKLVWAPVIAVAMIVLTAPIAQAQFTSNKTHTIYSGSQEGSNAWSAGSGFASITCTTASFSGTVANTSENTLVTTPTYSGCKDSLGRIVDIDNAGLTFTKTTGANKGQVHFGGTVTFTITAFGSVVCTVTLKAQTKNLITYHNLGGTSGIRLTFNLSSILSTTFGGFFNCGISDGEHSGGTYTGTVVLTGKDTAGSAAEIKVD